MPNRCARFATDWHAVWANWLHLGIGPSPKSHLVLCNQRSTGCALPELFYTALARFREQQGAGYAQRKFPLSQQVAVVDSTVIFAVPVDVSLALSPNKAPEVKAHVPAGSRRSICRATVLITPARVPDVRIAHSLALPEGSIVAMDRGYVDFRLFARWTEAGSSRHPAAPSMVSKVVSPICARTTAPSAPTDHSLQQRVGATPRFKLLLPPHRRLNEEHSDRRSAP